MGTLIATWRGLKQEEHHANTLNGMCGALGSLFPSPILGPLVILELAVTSGTAPVLFDTNDILFELEGHVCRNTSWRW